mmetsp:Transcript_8164/g.17499  ORF Transcript_8164/g.17499 Transcript_8164/m.17499 type:complete len:175 (+) Transcript_8164:18-542(+)
MAGEGGGFLSGCSKCGCLSFNSAYYNTFGVFLCDACKKDEKLMSKSNAKQLYMLTDKDLSKLGTVTKTNPQHKNWTAMKLYLQSQVEEVAVRKHGSLEDIEEMRHNRLEAKINDRLNKRKQQEMHTEKEEESMSTMTKGERVAQCRIRQKLEETYGCSSKTVDEVQQSEEIEEI